VAEARGGWQEPGLLQGNFSSLFLCKIFKILIFFKIIFLICPLYFFSFCSASQHREENALFPILASMQDKWLLVN
jgi:hypothetical protein